MKISHPHNKDYRLIAEDLGINQLSNKHQASNVPIRINKISENHY